MVDYWIKAAIHLAVTTDIVFAAGSGLISHWIVGGAAVMALIFSEAMRKKNLDTAFLSGMSMVYLVAAWPLVATGWFKLTGMTQSEATLVSFVSSHLQEPHVASLAMFPLLSVRG